ncbi:hypothetical protein [Niabella hibiscisoli]|uniref:hypothetical protein n=1 Tax=Niabella hibiscisoli TaxID=1825928 RepID=UPI001F0D0054|nr:hypothetical protein [Niabella hibiscisoli]MCH5715451.1 hypothetical protein [Niabella hibiscisoli]
MLILIAGPYRSGTNDDPQLMQQNLHNLEAVALSLFRKGYTPIIGEWVALPLIRLAGSTKPGEMMRGMKYNILLLINYWRNAMQFFALRANQKVLTKT